MSERSGSDADSSCGRPINTGPAIKDKEPPDKASAKT